MGGLETLKELKKIDPDTYYIVSSGYSSDDQVLQSYNDYGFDGYLSKPFSIEQLRKVLLKLDFSKNSELN